MSTEWERKSHVFDPEQIAGDLKDARTSSKLMVRGALASLEEGRLTRDHLPFLGFVERAQAFHQGVVEMVERGNPLAAATLLRSFAENVAVVFYLNKRPQELDKLRPGAQQGLPIGKIVAEAEKNLKGFQSIYKHLSSMAHPSGAGAFHTLRIEEDGTFFWQSHPTFRSIDDARLILEWLSQLRELTARVIQQTPSRLDAEAPKSAT